jgi:hypothetical protein
MSFHSLNFVLGPAAHNVFIDTYCAMSGVTRFLEEPLPGWK